MKLSDFIIKLLENCDSFEDNVEIYVGGKTDVIEEYIKQADGCEWCLDEILQINDIENRGGYLWLKTEVI